MALKLGIREAREQLTQLPEKLEEQPEAEQVAFVTRHGKEVLAIMPSETYQQLKEALEVFEETLDILGDSAAMAALRESLEDAKAGRVHAWEDVQRELGL